MNKLVHMAAAGSLLAFWASAQEPEAMAKKLKAEAEASIVQMKTIGAVRGMTVKNAPYSAEEVSESNQMLADGTRIHRENRTQVYRDNEGRTRRESPDSITITDPVANVTYLLNPKTMTGQKLAMAQGNFMFLRSDTAAGHGVSMSGEGPSTFSIHTSTDGPATITVNGVPMDEKAVAEAMAKAKASGSTQSFTYERQEIVLDGVGHSTATASGSMGGTAGVRVGGGVGVGGMTMAMPAQRMMVRRTGNGESLGKQVVEGVKAEGMREVSTIPAGTIGNDRPISITNESWYSEELQTMVSTKRSDPRTGDESFRMTNIRLGEPGAYLFQAPAGYQITEPKSSGGGAGFRE
ncbi:MAG: hypothetical protein ABI806_30055 [Candidatus Solibacter sp.]